MEFIYKPIGIIHTPFEEISGIPIQPSAAAGVRARVEVFPQYVEGLQDLAGFSHIYLLYHFHRAKQYRLKVVPFLDTQLRGLFATRAPRRPNSIGLSVVRLIEVDESSLQVENVDMLNGTPLLDIKPYVPGFNDSEDVRIGWLEKARAEMRSKHSDERFE